jgi:hypothetical protein
MANAILRGAIADGSIVPVSANGTTIITKGDWCAFSGSVVVPAASGSVPVTQIYLYSAAGMALDNNPTYDDQGVAINNTGFRVLRQGLARVTAALSATAGTIALGAPAFPISTGSGIVGQTGRTGLGALWSTGLPPVLATAAGGTGAYAGGVPVGVAQVVGVVGQGDITGFALDVVFNLATNR